MSKAWCGRSRFVTFDEGVEARLLLQHISGCRFRRFALQCQMHPLVPAVLLRMPGFDPLHLNPEAQPPHRQLAEAVQRMGRGKWHTVIGADHERQAKFLKGPLEHGEGEFLLRGAERFTGEQVAARKIGDSQRVAIPPIAEHEFAFVVGTPQGVGGERPCQLGPHRARGDGAVGDGRARGDPAPHAPC
jgi:hypothetical protein